MKSFSVVWTFKVEGAKKKNLKEQVMELERDQTHMLEAIKYLNDRLEAMEKKESDRKDILDSQGTIDEIIVKNCDDIQT